MLGPVKPTMTPGSNGPKIEDLRWERHLSVSALASKAGITPQYLRRIISGERSGSLECQESIARALDVPVEEIQR
jgi:transcriptional regulator with XRE-family HTH domain